VRDLFDRLLVQAESNSRQELDNYRRQIPEYRSALGDRRVETAVFDFAVFSRRLIVARAAEDEPLNDADLATLESTGLQRGALRMSMSAQRQVIGLHAQNVLREIHQAAAPTDTDDVLRLVGWLGPQAARGHAAYLHGYLTGVSRSTSVHTQIATVTRMLLSDELVEPNPLGDALGLRLADRYLVTVIRIPIPPAPPPDQRAQIIEKLVRQWRTPMDWVEPNELVILAPIDRPDPGGLDLARDQTLDLVREMVTAVGRPCAIGAMAGQVHALTEPFALARRISKVIPAEPTPRALYTVDDVFIELSVADAPQIDGWMRALAERLRTGSNLIRTLEAYYRHDMSRVAAATALCIHPRTLDYRLRRIRTLTGVDPASTRGVRLLSTVATRALAEGWS
jgi:hypothetical protein